jgi:20S proteasome subunit beta 1
MACKFKGGVIVGADSRTTTGAYIANRITNKLTPIHDKIICCRSGSSADTQAVADYVTYYLQMHSTELGELPQVKTAAKLFSTMIYNNKNNLMASILVAGWDPIHEGSVHVVGLDGSHVELPFAIGGSGSSYIYGFTDANYKEDMSEDECKKFVSSGFAKKNF